MDRATEQSDRPYVGLIPQRAQQCLGIDAKMEFMANQTRVLTLSEAGDWMAGAEKFRVRLAYFNPTPTRSGGLIE